MNAYTVGTKFQLSTLLSNVRSPNSLPKTLFGITASSLVSTIIRKFNYTALFMRHYIYSRRLNSLAISIQDFISKLLIKYDLENFSLMGWLIEKYSSLLKINI